MDACRDTRRQCMDESRKEATQAKHGKNEVRKEAGGTAEESREGAAHKPYIVCIRFRVVSFKLPIVQVQVSGKKICLKRYVESLCEREDLAVLLFALSVVWSPTPPQVSLDLMNNMLFNQMVL